MIGLQYLKRQVGTTGHGHKLRFISNIFDKLFDSQPGEITVHPSCVCLDSGSPTWPILGFVIVLILE